ncbi:tandem-95 repeat protein [Agarivorans sp. B2Z047]|uniref:VCBS domain-containing protein n=1 Tax=Agarivorans sp. B2Z047 TaxID=2652721 RepID=UPI00128CE032|nr:VCBS domain-containing protein [Agarivorans sp. B2Z047]MPW27516.1 tandem-95 repeat protein [Agarivorans sp. B2Z047]UQN44643.1 VCBS domain-containing protein [Agarivorans sp. B2Z047]
MTKQQDKSASNAKGKLSLGSNSNNKGKELKKAKRIDEDVARLKAKELRDGKTVGLSNQDLVADKSHQQLLSEQQALPGEGLLSEATNPLETISKTGKGGESANAKSSESDDTSKAVAGAALVEAPLIDGSKATARVGKGGGSSANSHWFAAHSFLNHVGVKGLTSNQLANVEGNNYKPSVTVQQLTIVNHSQTDQQQVPVIHAEGAQQQSGSVKEDKVSEVSGQLHVAGVDANQVSWSVESGSGVYGQLVVDSHTGQWRYQLDNVLATTNALAEGEHHSEQFVVLVKDNLQHQIKMVVSIEVEGSNDKPQISGLHHANVTEMAALSEVDGQLFAKDPDHNEQLQWAVSHSQGQYGRLTINPDNGQWQYQLDNKQPATLALIEGQKGVEHFVVSVTDSAGEVVKQDLTIQVLGTNEQAIIGGGYSGLLSEDKDVHQGQLRADGVLTVTDLDSGQNQFQANVLQGQFGSLSIDELGHWTYTADNSQTAIQGLNSGESLTDTLLVHSVDGTEQKITVTINGSDDKAVIGGTATATLTEDKDLHSGQLRVDGALTITDADNGEAQFQATALQGQFGTLTINNLGHWTYTADNSQATIQGLKTGDSVTDTLLVHSVDGTEQKITVAINGTDDKAVIAGTSTATLTEDKDVHGGQLRVDGALNITDADNGQAQFNAESLQGQFGTLTINNLGHWTYIADNSQANIQGLKTGDSVTDTVLVHSIDGTSQKVTVTINGSEDKAVIAGTSTATLTEDKDVHSGLLRVDGALTITDIDNGQNQFVADSYQGNYGYLSINQLGHWVYTANNNSAAIQGLKAGTTLTETLYVHAIDGTEKVLKININGTEDKALISGVSSVSLVEDKNLHAGFLHADGMLAVKDADIGDNQFQANASQGLFGELTINNNGHWTYTADNNQPAINQLKTGESLIDTIVVKSIDGSEHQIKVIIKGQDDKAVISGSSTLDVTEDKNLFQGQLRADGQLNVLDPDLGEARFIAGTLTGQYGHFTIDPSGAWTYTSNNKQAAIQSLNAGHEITDTVIIKTADGTEQTLCVHIHGTNDNAVISGTNTGVISNASGAPNILYANGQLHITDVDTGEAHFQSQVIAGAYGSFLTIKPNGEWQYAVDHYNANVIKLPHGQQLTESFTVKSLDGTEHTISTTIVGDNTPAIITGTDVALFKEDGTKQTATGQLNILDPNTGDEHFKPETLQGKYGELHIDDKGLWHYALNNQGVAVQSLKSGEIVDDLFFIKGHDGTPHGIQIQILGTNDLANINGVDAGVVVEDKLSSGLLITKGQLTITDIDNGQDLFPSGLQQGQFGQLVISNNGQWQYIANNNQPQIQQLSQTEALKEVFVVHSIDGTSHKIEVNIHGSNDIAKITGDTSAVLQEDIHSHRGNLVAQGQLVATDIDHGESQFIVDVNHAAYGQFSINNDGHWQYVVDNNSPNIQALTSKDTLTDTIIVRAVDGTEKSITVTINGSDDKAIIGGVDIGDVTEGTAGLDMSPDQAQLGMSLLGRSPLYVSGALTITDLDAGEATFDSRGLGFNYAGKYGDLMLREDGTWSYYADAGNIRIKGGHATNRGTAIDQLGKGETLTDTVTIYSKDGTAHDIVITIHGSNDRPYCSSEVTLNAGTEDTRQTITAAQLLSNTIDVDNNDAGLLTIENLHADHGSIKHNQDGSFSFTPEKDYNGQVHFTYDVLDAHGGTTHTGATTVLTAVQDSAIITEVSTGSITEDGSHRSSNGGTVTELATGSLTVVDPDTGENSFQFSQFGETKIYDPYNGLLRIDSAGTWTYHVDNAKLQYLAEGQTEVVIYRVHSKDGTPYDLHINVTGTNDAPTVNQVHLTSGTEDVSYQMQASQFGFTDIDTGDTLQAITLTNLPSLAAGKFVLDGRDVSVNQIIDAGDISKLQFVPAKDFNGDVHFRYTVNDGHADSAPASATLSINPVNDPLVDSGTRTLATLNEDSSRHISTAQLLEHLSDPDGSLQVVGTPTSPHGTFSGDAIHGYTFTPTANFHGDSVDIIYQVTDGTNQSTAHASIDITSVTDPATVSLHISAEQQVMSFGSGDKTAYAKVDGIDAGGPMHAMSAEITFVLDNGHPPSNAAVLLNYSVPGGHDQQNTITFWNASNLQFAFMGPTVDTGVNLLDGNTHRLTMTWDSGSGHLVVFDNGHIIKQQTVNQGGTFPNGGTFIAGTRDNSAGADNPTDYTASLSAGGRVFSATMVDHAVTPASVALGTIAHEPSGVLTNIMADGKGNFIDTTGHHTVTSGPGAHTVVVPVDSNAGTVPRGALLHLHPNVAVNAPDDVVTKLEISGLIKGTLLSDGHGHQHTIASLNDKVDIHGWNTASLTAQLPHDAATNMNVALTATTQAPDGKEAISIEHEGLQLDPSKPIPDATITGDSTGNTDEDHSVSGQLTVTDTDTSQAHFAANDISGTYGHLAINSAGQWTFTPNATANALTKDDQVHETYTVSSIDGTQHQITINIDGRDDNPIVTELAAPKTVIEDGGHDHVRTSGMLSISDPDTGDTHSITEQTDVLGTYGHFTIAANGGWHYELDNALAATQALTEGQHVTETFNVVVTDNAGGQTTHTMHFDVQGSNEAPTIATQVIHAIEDVSYHFTDVDFGFTDSDGGSLSSITITELPAASLGVLHLNGAAVTVNQVISQTDIANLIFTPEQDVNGRVNFKYSVNDGHDSSSVATAEIEIAARNDAPTSVHLSVRDVEDHSHTFSKNEFSFADVDTGDTLQHITITHLPNPTHGSLLLDGRAVVAGQQIDADNIDKLVFTPVTDFNGESAFKYSVSDGSLDSKEYTGAIHISADNDAPTFLAGGQFASLPISAAYEFSGNQGTDLSGRNNHAVLSGTITATTGADGTPDSAVQFHGDSGAKIEVPDLQYGQGITVSTTVKFDSITDSYSRVFDFGNGQAKDNILLTHSGTTDTLQLEFIDAAGQKHDLMVPHGVTPGQWMKLTATISHDGHMALYNNGQLLGETDSGAELPATARSQNFIGKSHWSQDGNLHGAFDNFAVFDQVISPAQIKALASASNLNDLLHKYDQIDHDQFHATVNVNQSFTINQDDILNQATDIDGDTLSVSHVSIAGNHGTIHDNGDGTWTVTPQSNYRGELKIEVDVTDGQETLPAHLTVQVGNASITGDSKLTTDETHVVSGQLTVTDPDTNQDHFIAQVLPSSHGEFSIDTTGHWQYTPNKAAQALSQGQSATDIVTVKTADGTQHQISVDLTGSDTAPTTVTTDLGKVESGHTHDFQATDLLANVTDVDTSTAGLSIVAGSLLSPHGTVVTNPDGSYSFTATPGFVGNDLAISFKISDGHNTIDANAIIDVTPPLAITRLEYDTGVSDSDFVTSDGHIILYGTGEPGSTIMGSGILSGPKAIVDANGHWKMDVSATDRADGTYTLTVFEVKADGSYAQAHHKITIDTAKPTLSIDPISNDDWVNHHDHQQDLTIAGATTHVADGNSVDVIVAGTHYSASVNNNHWQLTIPANQVANIGDNAYQVHAEVVATATGDSAHEQRQLVVSADLSTLVQTQAVEEDSKTTATGTLFAVGASETVTTTGVLQGNYGTLHMNADGSYHYTLDNQAAAIQQMGQTDSHADNFFISYTNNHGDTKHAVVNIGIHGTNDAPLLTGTFEISRSITTGSMTNTHSYGYINIDDIDNADNLNVEYIDNQGGHHQLDFTPGNRNIIDVQGIGYFNIDADGRWDFTFSHSGPERDKLNQEVAAGKIHTETVTLKVTDGSGESREEHLTVHIGDGKTGPQIFGASESVVTEDKVIRSHGLLDLLVGDVKVASGVTWALQAGTRPQYGDLTLSSDGSWQYQAHNDSARVQALAQGERLEETIMVTATDSLGHSVDQAMKLVIIGTNDVPVVGHALSGTVVEDHLLTLNKADLLANVHDEDAKDVLDVSHLSIVGGGTITQQGDHWVINPGVNYNGELRLNYTVTDGHVAIDNTMAIHVSPDADTPTMIFTKHVGDLASPLDTMAISGNENSDLALNINVSSPDTNETLTVEITGVPPGASLSAGTENNGIWTLQQSELTNLKVIPEADFHGHFDLNVSAISHDGSEQASVSQTIGVDVLAAPVLAGIGQSDAPQSGTETDTLTFSSNVDADLSNVASTGVLNDPIAPVDHYFQMLGMSRDNTPLESSDGDQTDLLPEFNVDNPLADADDLALQSSDPFDNPLAEGEDQHHQLDDAQDNNHSHSQLVDDNTAVDSHDDELLHSALNNMHNQW